MQLFESSMDGGNEAGAQTPGTELPSAWLVPRVSFTTSGSSPPTGSICPPLANSPVAMGLCVCPPDSLGPVWVACAVWSGQVSLSSLRVFNAVLGQLARWFYPFGSGAHCNNYYYLSRGLTTFASTFVRRSASATELWMCPYGWSQRTTGALSTVCRTRRLPHLDSIGYRLIARAHRIRWREGGCASPLWPVGGLGAHRIGPNFPNARLSLLHIKRLQYDRSGGSDQPNWSVVKCCIKRTG
jgi:hypothetical protein